MVTGWDRWDALLGGVLPSDKTVRFLYRGIKLGEVVSSEMRIKHGLAVQVLLS
jgi:hypothetical protein